MLGGVLTCTAWTACEACAGVAESREPVPRAERIGVVIHVMLATIEPERRKKDYNPDRVWAIAPAKDAVKAKVNMEVDSSKPPVLVEYWTDPMVGEFFGKNGKVNSIWTKYKWPIQLHLLGGEDCAYKPDALRPDGRVRDSILVPQTSTPWTGQLFRSINRVFAERDPHVLHVLLWWSVAEGDIDDWNAVSQTETSDGNNLWGYSRSAARGGPAVWLGAYGCLTPRATLDYKMRCAKVAAHEVGHALGLQHVEQEDKNLMHINPAAGYKDSNIGANLTDDQQKQAHREAREQFRSK